MKKKVVIVGGSRGLGRAVLEALLQREPETHVMVVARKIESLRNSVDSPRLSVESLDMSQAEGGASLLSLLRQWRPDEFWYFAGGGPFGPFAQKAFKDHRWALQVSLLTPAAVLHGVLSDESLKGVRRLVFVGSDIADSKGDPGAASYAAAKHGLKGLISSLVLEKPGRDIRLFRPGYMDTDLLPPGAPPRQKPGQVSAPSVVADAFLGWLADEGAPALWTHPSVL